MKPSEFEQLVCDHYRQKGYRAQTTSASNDYGIDVFAERYRARDRERPEYETSLKEWNEDAETIIDKIKGTWEYYVYYRWGYHIIFYRKEITNQAIEN